MLGQMYSKKNGLSMGKNLSMALTLWLFDLAGFEEVARQAANSKKRLDQTAIAVVKVDG
jgi:hypothetical protein